MHYISRSKFRTTRKSRVEIIPLIDVMFLLLCFFIYATMNMVVQQGIFVNLASSETSQVTPQDTEDIVLSVDREGTYYMNEAPVSKNELISRLKMVQDRAHYSVVVNADEDATHGQVIGLLDLVRKNGIEEAIFAVEPQS